MKNITRNLSSLWQPLIKTKHPKDLQPKPEPWMLLLVPNVQLLSWFPPEGKVRTLQIKRKKQWRVAAAILFLGGLTTMGGVLLSENNAAVHVKTENYQKKIALADGSIIHLNAHSSLQYNARFGEKKRQLRLLHGEAYFDVISSNIPFEVNLPDKSQIRVMGTGFNVEIAKENKRITTFLEKGKVNWKKEDYTQKLAPGDMVSTSTSPKGAASSWDKRQLSTEEINTILHWKVHPFSFNNTPLATIANELEAYYQEKIEISNAIKKDAFTGVFSRDMKLGAILEIISATTNYQLQERDNTWIIE